MMYRRPSFWIVLGVLVLDVGAALFAYPWLYVAVYGVPFGGPYPMGYFIFALIAAFTALVDFMILWTSSHVPPRAPW